MGGLCSKKKIADAETENNENEENTDKTPVGERRRKFKIHNLEKSNESKQKNDDISGGLFILRIEFEYIQTQSKEGARYVFFVLFGNIKIISKIVKIYLATKGAGLLGKTEWTDDEDEEEESVAENAPALVAVDNTPASEEAPVVTENQAEENQEAEKEAPEANENVEISDEPIQEAKESQPVGNSPEVVPPTEPEQ